MTLSRAATRRHDERIAEIVAKIKPYIERERVGVAMSAQRFAEDIAALIVTDDAD